MEEFGLESMEVVKAPSPFPGFGGTGWMCGAVTGGLIPLGLYFEARICKTSMRCAPPWLPPSSYARFERETGAVTCRKLQEDVVFGRYMDPAASPENMKAFERAKGFGKCSLFPGIGARIAAEIILESISRSE
jgi:hypothetical protein